MRRSDRLFDIIQILRDGQRHRAQDIADRLNVSVRTIYRDMDRLAASGVPVEGARGIGYKASDAIALPPLTLSPGELEALNLGIAIVSEAADPDLREAARSLADKVDTVLPEEAAIAEADAWKVALHPLASAARGFAHMATLRAAIRNRQKLRLTSRQGEYASSPCTIRPLHMDNWGRVWTLTGWCEDRGDFAVFRVDLIEEATPLPEMFVDEPGRGMADYRRRSAPPA